MQGMNEAKINKCSIRGSVCLNVRLRLKLETCAYETETAMSLTLSTAAMVQLPAFEGRGQAVGHVSAGVRCPGGG